jgi:hypothetical protein
MIKKKSPLLLALSLGSLAAAYADAPTEQQAQPTAFLMPGHYALKNGYEITPSVSALYWKAYEEGLDYAIKTESGAAFINNNGSVKRMQFDWDWGFRVGLGYLIPNRKMDLDLSWTRYETEHSNSTSATFPETLFSVWTYPGAGLSSENFAKARTDLDLNIIDFVMGAYFSPRKFLDIKAFAGLSTAWIDQKFSIHLSGGSNSQISNAVVLDDHIRLKNNFWGIGPKFGLNTSWILGWGFSIVGNANATLFYGLFDIKQNESVLLSGLSPRITYLDIDHNRFHLLRANLDLLLGMRWDRMFCNNRTHLSIEAGWENLLFWGQNQLMRFVATGHPGVNVSENGDLCLEGLTLKASFAF